MTPNNDSLDMSALDGSTPEGCEALEGLSGILLEIRDEYSVALPHEITRGFDYSTPEAQVVLERLSGILLEIRDDDSLVRQQIDAHAERKLALYERTLGLAVVPVLIRRGVRALGRKMRGNRRGGS